MKLTKQQLKQIIKEELEKVLKEDRWEWGRNIPSDQPSVRKRFNPERFPGAALLKDPETLDSARKTYDKGKLQGLTCDEVVRKYDYLTDLALGLATGSSRKIAIYGADEVKALRIFEANLIWDARPDCFRNQEDK